jgi:hypothetical protein
LLTFSNRGSARSQRETARVLVEMRRLGVLGLLGWRRKRKAEAMAAI